MACSYIDAYQVDNIDHKGDKVSKMYRFYCHFKLAFFPVRCYGRIY
jgi:hypothetical protein